MSESEFLAAVDYVAGVLAIKHKFRHHEPEDVRQIVCVHSLEALPKFDPSKGNLEGYLYRHSSNRLLNLRRDELGVRSDPPCQVCHDHARGRGKGHTDGSVCQAYEKWVARRRAKERLAMPCPLDKVPGDVLESRLRAESSTESDAEKRELYDLIDAHLPLDLRADYLRMKVGEPVKKPLRERVLAAIRDIIENPSLYEHMAADTTTDDEPENWFDDDDDDGGD